MSVLACVREGCRNVMCRRYSTQFGYVCDDCFEEMVQEEVNSEHLIKDFLSFPRREGSSYKDIIRENLGEVFEIQS